MPESPSLPRPEPRRGPRERITEWRSWAAWVGPARLIVGSLAVVSAGVAVVLLVRPGTPPTESTLPVAAVPVTSVAPFDVPVTDVPVTDVPVTDVPDARLVVHVAGSVVRPGVYTLDGSSRVADAVALAGGATNGADLDGLNLAAPLVDGQRVYVPEVGEVDPRSVPAAPVAPAGSASSATSSGSIAAFPIDLNRAGIEQLVDLPGIGPSTAAAIVGDRDANGPFASVDDLERVPGIGPAKLAALRDLVTV